MKLAITLTALVLLAAGLAQARDIDLVTLPPRAGVQLTIYNSEDLTLVRETRAITFKKGANRLQFSWAGTLIDPTSVYFRPLEHEAEIEVADTSFPADRPHVLIWNVESKFEGQVPVEVSYFTSGISWAADYTLIANAAETQMSVDGYVTVINNSGEDYENAQVRLVVGVVHLVEKITQLAQGGPQEPGKPSSRRLVEKELAKAVDKLDRDELVAEESLSLLARKKAPAKVVKEGLSEYFIFTVEGEQTVKTGWSQRMISFRAKDVPFDILYRYRPHQYGAKPVRFFMLANDADHKMGESPLPDGMIRVFRDNGRDGLNFFTAQATKYIPIREKIELNTGPDNQIVYERVVLDVARQNFLFRERPDDKQPGPPVPLPKPGDAAGAAVREKILIAPPRPPRPFIPTVIGWEEKRQWQEEIRNYRARPIKVEIRHVLPGDVEFAMEGAPGLKLYDFHTPEYTLDIPARTKQKFVSDGLVRLGSAQKQDRVKLK